MRQLTAIVIGAGNRGGHYSRYMSEIPEKYRVVGVADPNRADREYIRGLHSIPEENCFRSWEDILARPKMADIAMITTVDDMHYEPAMKAIELGYDLMLEKPVAITARQCADIAEAARRKGAKVLVCHVLRYTDFYGAVKKTIMNGSVGDVISMDMVEAIGNTHFAHSYVRGNWHTTQNSAPMLLAKSCHDLDMAQWLLDKPCKKVSSFGSLVHFREENAPAGAPKSCVDGDCPARESCPYDCLDFYSRLPNTNGWKRTVASGIAKDRCEPAWEEVVRGLRTKDYGLCVYHANNDVLDNQVVIMEFEGGTTVTLTVNAMNRGGRFIRIYGTKGELTAYMKDKELQLYTYADRQVHMIPVAEVDEHITGGHGGGDRGIVREMYDYFCGCYEGFRVADIQVSVRNHMIGFAAEQARLENRVVSLEAYLQQQGLEI